MSTDLFWVDAEGSAYDIGVVLGRQSREIVHSHLITSPLWHEVIASRHHALVKRMSERTRALFPDIYEEIRGLAFGLDLPLEQVFAWNSRGDLLSDTPDGCTTVQRPGQEIIIAHNEDGLPFFDGHGFILNVSGSIRLTSFCYPGSIPGHTFALNQHGIVMTANNLRLNNIDPEIPRMVLGRAMLNCKTLHEICQLLKNAPPSGGFHYSIAQLGDERLISLEFGKGEFKQRLVSAPQVHANHAILGCASHQNQIITQSSRDRQLRGSSLVKNAMIDPMRILRDDEGDGLPIWRRMPDDPDLENTIASASFKISKNSLHWSYYSGGSKTPIFSNQ